MNNTQTRNLPAIGDVWTYQVIVSEADYWHKKGNEPGHRYLGFQKGRECSPGAKNQSCPLCFDQWETRTAKIVDVQRFMDNSVEIVLDNGTRRMVVDPYGDACF